MSTFQLVVDKHHSSLPCSHCPNPRCNTPYCSSLPGDVPSHREWLPIALTLSPLMMGTQLMKFLPWLLPHLLSCALMGSLSVTTHFTLQDSESRYLACKISNGHPWCTGNFIGLSLNSLSIQIECRFCQCWSNTNWSFVGSTNCLQAEHWS